MTSTEIVSISMEGWSFCLQSSSQSRFLPLFMQKTLRWWETWSNAGSSACFGSDCWTRGPYSLRPVVISYKGTFLASFLLFCVTQLRCFVDSVPGLFRSLMVLWFVFVGTWAPLAQSEESGCWSWGSGLAKGQVWHSGCVPGGRFLHSGRKAWFTLGTTGYLILKVCTVICHKCLADLNVVYYFFWMRLTAKEEHHYFWLSFQAPNIPQEK